MSNTIIVKTRGRGRPIKSTPKQREAAADALACCASVCDAVEDVEVFEDKHERAIAIAATSAVLAAHEEAYCGLAMSPSFAVEVCAEAEALLRTGWKPGDDVTFTPRRPESETVVDVTPEFTAPTLPTHEDKLEADFAGDAQAALEDVTAELTTKGDIDMTIEENGDLVPTAYASYENPTVDDVD